MDAIYEYIKAVILGIVQGITEWLPISSTGHLVLINEFLNLKGSEAFINTFLVVIQLGSIIAVVVLYFRKLWPFYFKTKTKKERIDTWILWTKIIVACVPSGIVGLLFEDKIDELFYNPITIAIALIFYGVLFIIIESLNIRRVIHTVEEIDYVTATNLGVFQILALIPGTSRSGSTILGGRILGLEKEAISEFSFFMALPVMVGASGLKLLKCGFNFTGQEWIVLAIGTVVSFLVSIVGIKFMLNHIRKHDFKLFGVYRILLGIGVLVYFLYIKG